VHFPEKWLKLIQFIRTMYTGESALDEPQELGICTW
jgi:hypothetical protein